MHPHHSRGWEALALIALVGACEPAPGVADPDFSVVSIAVAPPVDTLVVGDSLQLTATVVTSNAKAPHAVTWTSSNGAVASVTQAGVVWGLAAGGARIVATSGHRSDSATVTVVAAVTPPSDSTWPNEPAGFTLVTDEAFAALNENGWRGLDRQTTNGSGLTLVTDPTAPLGTAGVLQFHYAVGYVGGSEPGVEFYDPAAPIKETYFGFWWKPSNPWQPHPSGVNKMAFLFTATGGCMYIMMFSDAGTYTVQSEPTFSTDTRRLPPNVAATPVALGVWHRVEWHVRYATSGTSHDGVVEWWLDGVLQGRYADLQTPADAGFAEYQFAPTWGGVGSTKTEADDYWFAHAHASRP
jgi:Bacterial Ig-like domain (group 2)